MPSTEIQWFPGHMAKTKRQIKELLPQVDAVLELRDARIPYSSKNPDIEKITENKPRLILLTKCSLADPAQTRAWIARIREENTPCIAVDCIGGQGMEKLLPELRALLSEKLARYAGKGMERNIKALVVGIPNVGKSSLINRLSGRKKTRVEDRPGVTRDKQWVFTGTGLDLLDTPGVLWPKFEDRTVGENLAFTGAISDGILDTETLAVKLCGVLRRLYPSLLYQRYGIREDDGPDGLEDWELFELIGRRRGFLARGGDVDAERCAAVLLDEFRAAKIGKITLERPGER